MAERGEQPGAGRATEGGGQGAAQDAVAPAAPAAPPARGAGSATWDGAAYPEYPPAEPWRKAVALARLAAIVAWTLVCFALHQALRLLHTRLFPGLRPARIAVARAWARVCARLLGLKVEVVGAPVRDGGAMVANHSSWSDILVLMTAAPVTFVSKAEVRSWPGIGLLAAAADTLFIERRRTQAKAQEEEMRARILSGQKLIFFPEGTSTDARRVAPFKSTLFSVFFADGLRETISVQPVSVVYLPKAGGGRPPEFYGWWGDMDFGGHIWTLLTRSFGGRVQVVFHDPAPAASFKGRKEMCAHCDREVRAGLETRLGPPPPETAPGSAATPDAGG